MSHATSEIRALSQNDKRFARSKQEMEREGVLVFDPAPLLCARKRETGEDEFLKTDTHWTAGAVEAVADELRRFIEARTPLISGSFTICSHRAV